MSRKPILKLERDYRSRLEERIAAQLEKEGVAFDYESRVIKYKVPARDAKYTPDFLPRHTTILIEGKGYFRKAGDRQKLIHIKDSNPGIDIRLVFQDASKPIYKGSKTTYGQWASDHQFPWADKGIIPAAWIAEMKKAQKR